jgi:hypothetical protein
LPSVRSLGFGTCQKDEGKEVQSSVGSRGGYAIHRIQCEQVPAQTSWEATL